MGILASPVLLAATAGLVVYSVVTRFIQWKRLRHIAGQPLAGWTNLWLSRQAATGKISSKFDEACRKYGEPATAFFPILRVLVLIHQVPLFALVRTT